jgi:hypothetical protein
MAVTFSAPVVYNSGASSPSTHTVTIPAAAENQLILIFAQSSIANFGNVLPAGYTRISSTNSTGGKDYGIYAKVAGVALAVTDFDASGKLVSSARTTHLGVLGAELAGT